MKGGINLNDNDNIYRVWLVFCNEYLEKVFYYCLKRTGSPDEAEELTQDIAINVMSSLQSASGVNSFSAWVWKIASNRYSAWAKQKKLKRDKEENWDYEDTPLMQESEDVLQELQYEEQLALMRRELAFIRGDYRKIIVEHYINGITVSQISDNLSQPIGTVKAKLHRARKMIKEGMDMTREFGKRSYDPGDIMLVNARPFYGNEGERWEIINRLLYKNIYLHAYDAPCTAQDLAIELGVALPYMEEELAFLVKEGLLAEKGGEYVTNFAILTADMVASIVDKVDNVKGHIVEKLNKTIELFYELMDEVMPDWDYGFQTREELKWGIFAEFLFSFSAGEDGVVDNVPNKVKWHIVGYEKTESVGALHGVGLNGGSKSRIFPKARFLQYVFSNIKLDKYRPGYLLTDEMDALVLLVKGGAPMDESAVHRLVEYGYVNWDGEKYVPRVAVLNTAIQDIDVDNKNVSTKAMELNAEINGAKALYREVLDYAKKQIEGSIPDHIVQNGLQSNSLERLIGLLSDMIFTEAEQKGILVHNPTADNRHLGAMLDIQ